MTTLTEFEETVLKLLGLDGINGITELELHMRTDCMPVAKVTIEHYNMYTKTEETQVRTFKFVETEDAKA